MAEVASLEEGRARLEQSAAEASATREEVTMTSENSEVELARLRAQVAELQGSVVELTQIKSTLMSVGVDGRPTSRAPRRHGFWRHPKSFHVDFEVVRSRQTHVQDDMTWCSAREARYGLRAVRIGEALHPSPPKFSPNVENRSFKRHFGMLPLPRAGREVTTEEATRTTSIFWWRPLSRCDPHATAKRIADLQWPRKNVGGDFITHALVQNSGSKSTSSNLCNAAFAATPNVRSTIGMSSWTGGAVFVESVVLVQHRGCSTHRTPLRTDAHAIPR